MKRLQALAALGVAMTALPLVCSSTARADEGKLQKGDYVAVIGDSITEQKLYSVLIEDYLLMCRPAEHLTATQFGWGGETSWGFAARMQNDVVPFSPSVATTNFGMNDGGYSPENADKAKRYHDGQTSVVEQLKRGGVRFIVVGSPGCVDSDTAFRHNPEQAKMYNETLAAERDIARQVAQEQGVAFADVFTPMHEAMDKAKAKYGHDYHVAGPDGVHPRSNGHLIMAYAYLKALGCDGNIGTFTVSLGDNKAEVSDGHQLIWFGNGRLLVESTRYPFCFYGDPTKPDATTGIINFFPFNQDLNRLMLVVSDAKSDQQYKVTWGEQSKTFSGADLTKGVNLAAEFLENPFSKPFEQIHQQVQRQQNYETPLVKQSIHSLLDDYRLAPEEVKMLEGARSVLVASDQPLREHPAMAVMPVRHTIVIEEAK
jgi:lysophospholipase L1-like esterase